MQISDINRGIQTWKLDSWREFHDAVQNHLAHEPAFIYRGQADAAWPIKSSLDRLEEQHAARQKCGEHTSQSGRCSLASREVHLAAFRQSLLGRPGISPPPSDENELWALAQHHGLATPMLDWSLSPYVALFFAFEDRSDSQDRLVVAISSSAICAKDSPNNPAPKPYMPQSEASYRLLAQGSLLIRMPRGAELEEYVLSHFAAESAEDASHAKPVMIKIAIPNREREGCLKMLNKMNINRMTLFPDADGAARYVNSLWEIDFDTTLGYIRN